MHELELPVMVTVLFCEPPRHQRFYVRIRVTITDQDSYALIDFTSNLERSEWNLIHLLELIS